MNCPRCNAPIEKGDIFCQNCGSKIEEVNNMPQDFQIQEEPKEIKSDILEINSNDMNKVYEPNEQVPSVLEINSSDMYQVQEPQTTEVPTPSYQDMNMGYGAFPQEPVVSNQNYQDMNSMNEVSSLGNEPANYSEPSVNSFQMNEPDKLDDEVILPTPQEEVKELPKEEEKLSPVKEEVKNPDPVRNNTEYTNMQGDKKQQTNNSTPLIVLMVVVILALTGALIYSVVFNNNDNDSDKDSNNNDDKTPTVVTKTVNTYTFNGYKFQAPEGWKFSEGTKTLTIVNSTEDVAISSQLVNLTFANVVLSLPQIEENWQQAGYEVSNKTTSSINDKQYYIYDLTYNGYTGYIIITDLTTNTLLSVVIGQTSAVTIGTKDDILNIATSLTPDTTSSIAPIVDPNFTASQEAIENIPFNTVSEDDREEVPDVNVPTETKEVTE